jgi:hypothetical protein
MYFVKKIYVEYQIKVLSHVLSFHYYYLYWKIRLHITCTV